VRISSGNRWRCGPSRASKTFQRHEPDLHRQRHVLQAFEAVAAADRHFAQRLRFFCHGGRGGRGGRFGGGGGGGRRRRGGPALVGDDLFQSRDFGLQFRHRGRRFGRMQRGAEQGGTGQHGGDGDEAERRCATVCNILMSHYGLSETGKKTFFLQIPYHPKTT
jgi:hypothetical protein